jgi:serine/threonine protein kinase
MSDDIGDVLDRLVGRVIARRYRVEGLLNIGGMGAVFRAHNIEKDEPVAIKVLRPDLRDSREAIARFGREAAVAAKLDHPNCLTVTDIGQTRTGTRWMAMPLLDGQDLTHELVRPVPLARAFDITVQVFRGLEHAHAKGVVHRDIKPDNIFVSRDRFGVEVIKICDFGIARLLDEPSGGRFVTRLGIVLGTPAYMSPEQAAGASSDRRADLYSAGLVLYELLAGRSAFAEGSADVATMIQNQIEVSPAPLPATVPPIFGAIVQQLLHDGRDRRLQTATEVLRTLERASDLVWPGGGLARALQAAAVQRPAVGQRASQQWPSERSDAQAFDDALKSLLARATPFVTEQLQEGIRPRGSVTQMSGIDIDNLELVELEPEPEPEP